MRSKGIKVIGLFVGLLLSTLASGQDCDDVLFRANNLFESGEIYEAIDLLRPCVNSMGPDEKFEALKFLAIASQQMDEIEDMEYYIERMLDLQPQYLNYPNNDPTAFAKVLESYKVSPKLFVGAKMGSSMVDVKLIESYSAFLEKQQYVIRPGYQFGLGASYNLIPGLPVEANVMLSGATIEKRIDVPEVWEYTSTEQLRFFDINLNSRKSIDVGQKTSIFVGANAGLNFLMSSKLSAVSTNIRADFREQYSSDPKEYRNKLQPNAGLLFGVDFKNRRGTIGLEGSYNFYSSQLNKSDLRYADQDFLFQSQQIDDDIKLRIFRLNLTFNMPLSFELEQKKN